MTKLECSKCGATVEAACNCGAAYVPAGARAAQAVAENPEKSDRAIAAELGVGSNTVRRARKPTAPDGAVEKRVGRDGKARRPPQQSCRRTPRQKDKAPAPNYTMAKAQVAFSNCVVDILEQLGSPRRECEFIAWAHTNLTDIAAKRGNAIQALAAESVDEDDNEAEIKQQVAAAKRDLIQRLEPHLDALEQGVALLRGDAERRDAPPMADRPKP
jgi:DNA-binding transcriptional MocR family regulator